MKARHITATILAALSICSTASAQEMTLKKIKWLNPWLETSNAAGLSCNSSFLGDSLKAFSDARLEAEGYAGSLKGLYDTEKKIDGNLGIDSYSKIGKVFLQADFNYNYNFGTNCRWRGLHDPYEMPFAVADSIPGNISDEVYSMKAAIALPLSGKWSMGLMASYDAGIMAKHKDLRNKNTCMTFDITPGVSYNGKRFLAGLNIGFTRNTEKIEYTQIDDSSEKYLFDLYGLWLYKSNGYNSAEKTRYKLHNDFYGNLQLGVKGNGFRIFNDFGLKYAKASQSETGYNNLQHGDINKFTLSDKLFVDFGLRHRIKASADWSKMNGYRYLQRQELDPDSKIRLWVSYGGPVFCYERDQLDGDISYTYRDAESAFNINWEITAGISDRMFSHKYLEYPLSFSQSHTVISPYLSGMKHLGTEKNNFEVGAMCRYDLAGRNGMRNAVSSQGVKEGETPWQLTGALDEEYDYFATDIIKAGLSLRYAGTLKKNRHFYTSAAYVFNGGTSGPLKGCVRHGVDIVCGISF